MARPPAGPPRAMSPLQEAMALHQRGKLIPARKLYREVVARQPNNADALELLGLAAAELGDYAEAIRVLSRAAVVNTKSLNVQFNLGMAHKQLRHWAEAETNIREAVRIGPVQAEMLTALGVVLFEQGKLAEAAELYMAALRLNPRLADAYYNLGSIHALTGDLPAAATSFGRAAQLDPKPVEALTRQGNVLMTLQVYPEAIEVLQRACAADPKFHDAWALLGTALRLEKRFPEAIEALNRAVALNRERGDALLELIHTKRHAADWKDIANLDKAANRLAQKSGTAATSMLALLLIDDPAVQRRGARDHVKQRWPGAEAPAAPGLVNPGSSLRARSSGPLRIGYFSSDYGDHPVGYAVAGFIAAHDRTRFEVHAFSLGTNGEKPFRPEIVKAFDHWHQVHDRPAGVIVALARSLSLDIAIDLNGHTTGARTAIFTQRAAPVQVNYLGFPASMGLHQMDYLIADGFVIPAGTDGLYDEKIVRLPGCYLPNDLAREATAQGTPSRAANGLPDAGLVFAAFNTINKISPEMFASWMRIMVAVPGSTLWLPNASETIRANLRREAEAHGVAGARLVFGPFVAERRDHIARHGLADLFFDCVPYNAHTTAADALWAGLPVLTCAGKSFPSRVAASLLRCLGLPELVATSLAGYEAAALRLAREPAVLADVRARLLDARDKSGLFDAVRFARRMEWGFAHMAQRSAAGHDPEAFDIPAAG